MGIRNQNWNKDELALPSDNLDAQSIADSDEVDYFGKKIKYGSRIQAAWAVLGELFTNSTVHGVRYFSERRRHWTEKIWWIITIGLSMYICGFVIFRFWIYWDQNPVIISFDEKLTPVWSIPFPAVTICPETKTYMDKLNFTEAYHTLFARNTDNMTEEALARMQSITHLCNAHLSEIIDFGQNFTTNEIYDIIKEIAPDLNDTMYYCKWRNEPNNCYAFFLPILTEEGICYTFNALNSREIYTDEMAPDMMTVTDNPSATEWYWKDGYYDTSGYFGETYPLRTIGAREESGLFAMLRLFEQDLEYLCRGPVQGFKIILHTPDEVPQVSKNYFRVQLLQEVMVSVKPQMITTPDGLRHYEPNRRQCYFNSERQLRFFKVYTQRNCELECLSNFTRTECGCVKFSMPRDSNTPICGADKIICYNDAKNKLFKKDFEERLSMPTSAPKGCNCLPACTSITYDAEISQAKFDFIKLANAYKLDESSGVQFARLSIYFKENGFIALKRSELYGWINFISDCGGLLSLFMGVSVLSIVEVIYYFTLRLCCTLRIRRSRKRKSLRAQRNAVAPAEKNIPNIIVTPADEKDVPQEMTG